MREKGLIDIYILEILNRHSCSKRRLSQKDIINYLDVDYSVPVNRNTLSEYLRELREEGYITGERGVYLNRKFSDSEIKMIVNSIIYSKSIPRTNVKDITKKLKDIADPKTRRELRDISFIDEIAYTDNEYISDNIIKINEAIEKRKKIEYVKCQYDIDGKLKDVGKRIVSPYYIISEKSRFFLLCYAGRGDVEPRRVDRISDIKILKENRVEINQIDKYSNNNFRIHEYIKEHIYMYSGQAELITIKIKRENIGDFIDWFGKDYKYIDEGANIVVRVKANIDAVYFWALQYGRVAEVIAPERLRHMIKEGATELIEKYNNEPIKIKKT